jgi:hypothetical protein
MDLNFNLIFILISIRYQVSAQQPTKKTADLIEEETDIRVIHCV